MADRYQQQKQQRLELVERNILSRENKNGRSSRLDGLPYSMQANYDLERAQRPGAGYIPESREIKQS